MNPNETFLSTLNDIPGIHRCETTTKEALIAQIMGMTQSAYSHQMLYERYCTIQDYIDAPPRAVFEYLADVHCLEEWTFSTRDFEPTDEPGLYVGRDTLEVGTKIYCRVAANPEAMTVDYHCAWDQGEELWMIYLMRVIPAELVLGKRGSVVTWTNCRHPNYDRNPHPELAPPDRAWVGAYWDMFYAGHTVELGNLKAIVEHRHAHGQPLHARARSAA
ncbi:SRPBCC family protein [Pendulispora albinea]|uniref:SRPBCC family protein n=1 Tax=Pendulispora albinea TaxID=2741071 RepID=A0ABZ2MAU9_9BACT